LNPPADDGALCSVKPCMIAAACFGAEPALDNCSFIDSGTARGFLATDSDVDVEPTCNCSFELALVTPPSLVVTVTASLEPSLDITATCKLLCLSDLINTEV